MQLGVTGQSVLTSLAVVMVLGIVVRVSVLMGGSHNDSCAAAVEVSNTLQLFLLLTATPS